MPNPLRRKSGCKNEEHEEKKRSSPCSHGGKKLSAAKYREILLNNQGREGSKKS
ncbi:hypothetical protein MKX03_013053, partial [Papaver bracteatum]